MPRSFVTWRGLASAVSWLIPDREFSEHPAVRGMCQGENWTIEFVNAHAEHGVEKHSAL